MWTLRTDDPVAFACGVDFPSCVPILTRFVSGRGRGLLSYSPSLRGKELVAAVPHARIGRRPGLPQVYLLERGGPPRHYLRPNRWIPVNTRVPSMKPPRIRALRCGPPTPGSPAGRARREFPARRRDGTNEQPGGSRGAPLSVSLFVCLGTNLQKSLPSLFPGG
jgi:hypothetical protein